ncbi:PDZ domain-containing protein [Achromobacter ruhlandii]|uniref:PDZ domain-containing protein n=1 Tax=Achromobacter TaxID=222 RepID=UPI0021F11C30|nr:PDZ domain-containing protein [Achromobacter ruhlandii]MCV6795661.1 PDZ domain-containing protein [Achromobacter ruhlandii]MCV6800609.1 PDZ domain-containing protein [Achromobacter ruhlandii]MCV6807301.1 PDZ domain-containing protein [Achromobacter ruhlandii]MCV6817596.1 PDZ domain-containing protein [Achromobacter ruhlandii]MEB6659860.1 PDZ domain-containing protein [Achromobacter ruhlandii]
MKKTLIAVSLVTILGGCAAAQAVHEDLPPAASMRGQVNTTGKIDVFSNGMIPQRPIVRIASIGAHGNAYADNKTLRGKMEQEALSLGADCLIIVGGEISKDETIGSYGGGVFTSNQIQRPHLYGVACKYAQVGLGLQANSKTGVIQYVTADSPAAKAGIVEGDTLLAINGVSFSSNPFVFETEVGTKKPGDVVKVEVLDKAGVKVAKTFTLTHR